MKNIFIGIVILAFSSAELLAMTPGSAEASLSEKQQGTVLLAKKGKKKRTEGPETVPSR